MPDSVLQPAPVSTTVRRLHSSSITFATSEDIGPIVHGDRARLICAHDSCYRARMRSLIGQVVDGKYLVQEPMGEGAMGAVVSAECADGLVALKLLKNVDKKLRGRQRFAREVRFLEQLVHPNVVKLLGYGRDERLRVLYFAMELLRGDPVSRITAHGRSSVALALTVVRQAAEGIASAHELGIVHRDLKPANLMLVPRDDGSVQVKILDFGLAYVLSEERLTDMGTAPGTVSYMPPEQLQGKTVDQRGDLYCLGVVIFELLTGQKPFPGDTQVDIAVAVLNRPPRRVDEIVHDIPSGLADLVASMLSKDPDDRPQSADELVERIAAFQRSSDLRPPTVDHVGPADDVRLQWDLRDAVAVADVIGSAR